MNKRFLHKELTDSTNSEVHRMAADGEPEGLVVSADLQTAGKGRRGRSWESESGASLLFSVLLRPQILPDAAPQITLLMALAVVRVIRERLRLPALIKWPNDVVVNTKKVCGILTEMYLGDGVVDHVVIGTGVNMNQTVIPMEFEESATSLFLEMEKAAQESDECNWATESGLSNREVFLRLILETFEEYYDLFLQTQNLSAVMEEYNRLLVSLEKEVRVLDPKGAYSGVSKGINENGELLVESLDGETVAVYAGEVSVRGLYGYV